MSTPLLALHPYRYRGICPRSYRDHPCPKLSLAAFASISSTAASEGRSLLHNRKSDFVGLHEVSDLTRVHRTFSHTLENTLRSFDIQEIPKPLPARWELLRKHLLDSHDYRLPLLNPNQHLSHLQSLLGLFQRPHIRGTQITESPTLSDYIFTPSEVFWGLTPEIQVPFTTGGIKLNTHLGEIQGLLDQVSGHDATPLVLKHDVDHKVQSYSLLNGTRDGAAAILLATPYLDSETLLYELGCWHGQNLMNLLFYASLRGRTPKRCIGIDINSQALTMAQSFASMIGLEEPFLQFHLSNALFPLSPDIISRDFKKEVRLALRLIPVLEPNRAQIFLEKMRKGLRSSEDKMIVSFALPAGQRFDENMKRAETQIVKQEEFSGGTVFFQEFAPLEALPAYLQDRGKCDVVVNTYYTIGGFERLIKQAGFSIDHTIHVKDLDNERVAVTLSPA